MSNALFIYSNFLVKKHFFVWSASSICPKLNWKRTESTEFPPYLRFNLVQLSYLEAEKGTVEERFAWVQKIFRPSFKRTLIGSKLKFICAIEDEAIQYMDEQQAEKWPYENSCADFEDYETLLLHIGSKLLQIFDQCFSYKFCITLPNKNGAIAATEIISEILQFDSVSRCSNVSVLLRNVNYHWPPELPIKTIGNWLNRPLIDGQKQSKRILQIKVQDDEIPNVYEMFEHLDEVFSFLL